MPEISESIRKQFYECYSAMSDSSKTLIGADQVTIDAEWPGTVDPSLEALICGGINDA